MTKNKWLFCILIVSIVIIAHQLSRIYAFDAITKHGSNIKILPFFNIVEVWNPGISFGMLRHLARGSLLISTLAASITLFLFHQLYRTSKTYFITAYSLIIGGAIGNTIDRLYFGAVADYLDFHAYGYHWPSFNVTDTAVFIGAFLLLILSFKNGDP